MADQALRRLVHGGGVERVAPLPGAVAVERERRAAVDDAIEIVPRCGREARVEIVRRTLAGEHADRVGPNLRVQRFAHLPWLPVLGEIEMRDLGQRMHARIGAPRPARRVSRPRRP